MADISSGLVNDKEKNKQISQKLLNKLISTDLDLLLSLSPGEAKDYISDKLQSNTSKSISKDLIVSLSRDNLAKELLKSFKNDDYSIESIDEDFKEKFNKYEEDCKLLIMNKNTSTSFNSIVSNGIRELKLAKNVNKSSNSDMELRNHLIHEIINTESDEISKEVSQRNEKNSE